jgi:hypothetical protein
VAWTIFADLSGEGDIDVADLPNALIYTYRVYVSDTGAGHAIDLSAAARYVDLGWTALFETITEADSQGPAGTSYLNQQWIEFLYQTYITKDLVDTISGVSGLHYSLKPSVVVTIVVFTE